jgi:hypothetical protein
MWRLKVWSIMYTPMIIGVLIMIYASESFGIAVMSTTFLTLPIAMNLENRILNNKGIDVTNGSPLGNFLAKLLGVIVVGGAIFIFYTMANNIYTGNY